MDLATYEIEAQAERDHWWFVGRRQLFGRIIDGLNIDRTACVLDIGTSTGTNLRMLRDLGFENVTGLDSSDTAIRFCADKGFLNVIKGNAEKLPFDDDSFSLVLATDVIEHVDQDVAALAEIHRVLVPGGSVLVTVPAFSALWGLQDEVAHHKRRYRMKQLRQRIEAAGLSPVNSYYFNFFLFFPIFLARRLIRGLGIGLASENSLNSGLINRVLTKVMAIDVMLAPRVKFPFGVSALVVGRKLQ